jgi:hypothetical protein
VEGRNRFLDRPRFLCSAIVFSKLGVLEPQIKPIGLSGPDGFGERLTTNS